MFLTKLVRYGRKLHDDERGVALAAVMGLMFVGLLLSTLVVSSVLGGISSTTSTRAGVQSETSAEAGVDVAHAAIVTGTGCQATYTSTTAPVYTATLSYTTAASAVGATWVAGCPTASAQFVKVTSVGSASAKGVGSNSTGDSTSIEAIFNKPVTTATITKDGPAVYAYSSQGYGGSGTLVSEDGTADANVMVKTGNVVCSGAASDAGDLLIADGNLTISGSCNLGGNVWVMTSDGTKGIFTQSGGDTVTGNVIARTVTVNSGVIKGSVFATSSFLAGSATIGTSSVPGNVTVANGNYNTGSGSGNTVVVNGNVWASGTGSESSGDVISGNMYGQNLVLGGGNVKGQAFAKVGVTGVTWATISGSIVAQTVQSGMTATGGITKYPGGTPTAPIAPTTPTAPTVPAWIDFTYVPADWAGFGAYTLTTAQCNAAGLQTAENSFNGGKGVIDARACTSAISLPGTSSVTLTNDTAIISAKGFDLGYSGGSGSFQASSDLNLWLITPDTVTSTPTKPDCASGNPTTFIAGGFSFSSHISTLIYTPCEVSIGSGVKFYGQIFSGLTTVSGAAQLFYTPVGLPAWDLATGSSTSTSATTNPWTSYSTRNIG
ncbi:MAG: hypothetical protein JWQ39_2679 [Glaciihabitans sp.]|nr:hypothetical protein [Glaciihabitans sp.]